jgi:ATP-dependent helicase HrpA
MVRRDFGPKSYNYTPPTGYGSNPHYFSERSTLPQPAPNSEQLDYWLRRRDAARDRIRTPEDLTLGNRELPMFEYREAIIDAIENNPVTIIVSETGSGKSTQVPQFLFEAGYTSYLTQPRRLPARKVAERIDEEISRVIPDFPKDIVGFKTAETDTTTENTRVTVLTDGLRLVQEINGRNETEREVLIIDEVHEWNANIEVLVAWSKQLLKEKPNLRVVLMSATMEAQRIQNYFDDVTPQSPPIIEVPGRTFPVESREAPKSTVVKEACRLAEEGKNILVFVPGKREIQDVIDEITRHLPAELLQGLDILPLHSKLSPQEQDRATNPTGRQKIVVSTNVAQTSLTISDIDAVVDSGLERRTEINEQGIEGLMLRPISKADCIQRRGRAGRVKEGEYVLTRLNDDVTYEPFISRDDYPTAEILRSDTSRHVLRTAAVGIDFATLDLVHPLSSNVIDRAKYSLRTLGAFDEDNHITRLGLRMNEFPLRPSLGRMMAEADRFSVERRAYVAAVAATMESGGLRYFGQDVGRRWKKLTEEQSSDQLAELDIFLATQGMAKWKQVGYDLDLKNSERAHELYGKLIKRSGAREGILPPPTDDEREDVLHCLYTSFGEEVYRHVGDGNYQRIIDGGSDERRSISNRSVVRNSPSMVVGNPYRYERVKRTGVEERHILGEVTTVASTAALARAAMHLCNWRPVELGWRDGQAVQVERQYFADIHDLGYTREVTAEPSEAVRRKVIDHALAHPGGAQRQLREIKKELERLWHFVDHRSVESWHPKDLERSNEEKRKTFKLTQDDLVEFIEAAAPADILDPSLIDNNLREMNLTIDDFISPEARQKIIENAPATITASGVELELAYQSGKPLVRRFDKNTLRQLSDEVYLPDGRQVKFVYERKPYSLTELRYALQLA